MTTALLCIDMQMGMAERIASGRPHTNAGAEGRVAALLALFRERGQPVVHVLHDEPGTPFARGLPSAEVMPCAAPMAGETVLWKSRSSAFAGTGTSGSTGDGGAATTRVNNPVGVAVDPTGTFLYIGDNMNNRVRRINLLTNTISTIAGNGTAGYITDGVAATSTRINGPRGVAVDALGNVYFADANNNSGTNLISTNTQAACNGTVIKVLNTKKAKKTT